MIYPFNIKYDSEGEREENVRVEGAFPLYVINTENAIASDLDFNLEAPTPMVMEYAHADVGKPSRPPHALPIGGPDKLLDVWDNIIDIYGYTEKTDNDVPIIDSDWTQYVSNIIIAGKKYPSFRLSIDELPSIFAPSGGNIYLENLTIANHDSKYVTFEGVLNELTIKNCVCIYPIDLKYTFRMAPQLTTIDLTGTENISFDVDEVASSVFIDTDTKEWNIIGCNFTVQGKRFYDFAIEHGWTYLHNINIMFKLEKRNERYYAKFTDTIEQTYNYPIEIEVFPDFS